MIDTLPRPGWRGGLPDPPLGTPACLGPPLVSRQQLCSFWCPTLSVWTTFPRSTRPPPHLSAGLAVFVAVARRPRASWLSLGSQRTAADGASISKWLYQDIKGVAYLLSLVHSFGGHPALTSMFRRGDISVGSLVGWDTARSPTVGCCAQSAPALVFGAAPECGRWPRCRVGPALVCAPRGCRIPFAPLGHICVSPGQHPLRMLRSRRRSGAPSWLGSWQLPRYS